MRGELLSQYTHSRPESLACNSLVLPSLLNSSSMEPPFCWQLRWLSGRDVTPRSYHNCWMESQFGRLSGNDELGGGKELAMDLDSLAIGTTLLADPVSYGDRRLSVLAKR